MTSDTSRRDEFPDARSVAAMFVLDVWQLIGQDLVQSVACDLCHGNWEKQTCIDEFQDVRSVAAIFL